MISGMRKFSANMAFSLARPVDTYEFLSQNTIEVDIAGMDTKAVVHHREMTKALALETVDRQHHVRGVLRMNEVSDDAVCLLPHA